jgi:phage FluMu protein Com
MTVQLRQTYCPAPQTIAEFVDLLERGVLITTGGKQLVRRPCLRCGNKLLGSADGLETCWCEVDCPTCHAVEGRNCRRPSEHDVPGRAHDSRWRVARERTEQRASAGDPDLPTLWDLADQQEVLF